MRLKYLEPGELTPEQKSFYDEMLKGISQNYTGSQTKTASGALVGPFNPWLHAPRFGRPVWAFNRSLNVDTVLPARVREVVTFAVGTHFQAAYEVGSHCNIARTLGMDEATIKALASGEAPSTLSPEERLAHDFASKLCQGGVVPEELYRRALDAFGFHGLNELLYLSAFYAVASMTMNAFDVAPPEHA